ncbi:MAG: arginine repressor [Clostridia bacterium]|nr:arginine repressor [Clostridia bacterium]
MKKKRHEAIIRLIEQYCLATQGDLLEKLREEGFDTTQATISRDIKDLRLIKKVDELGRSRYAVHSGDSGELLGKYRSIFSHSVISADYAGNTLVVKCYTGMAQAACAAFDSMHWEGLVGTLAGDDTIFALCRTPEHAEKMMFAISEILG